jgi:hypothetical protein
MTAAAKRTGLIATSSLKWTDKPFRVAPATSTAWNQVTMLGGEIHRFHIFSPYLYFIYIRIGDITFESAPPVDAAGKLPDQGCWGDARLLQAFRKP